MRLEQKWAKRRVIFALDIKEPNNTCKEWRRDKMREIFPEIKELNFHIKRVYHMPGEKAVTESPNWDTISFFKLLNFKSEVQAFKDIRQFTTSNVSITTSMPKTVERELKKILKERTHNIRILYPAKLSFEYKDNRWHSLAWKTQII